MMIQLLKGKVSAQDRKNCLVYVKLVRNRERIRWLQAQEQKYCQQIWIKNPVYGTHFRES